jgi:hypothetical protein
MARVAKGRYPIYRRSLNYYFMAKHTSFHHKKSKQKVEYAQEPSLLASLFVLILIGKQILGIFLSPLRYPLRVFFLILSVWLGVGTLVYGVSYIANLSKKQVILEERAVIQTQENQWKQILGFHPTSREALLGAYATSVALGEDEQAAHYKALLQRIDPNDERVKNL